MEPSLYQYVIAEFDRTTLTYEEIAEGSGVPKRTVEKIARKETLDPGVSKIEKLVAFFRNATPA